MAVDLPATPANEDDSSSLATSLISESQAAFEASVKASEGLLELNKRLAARVRSVWPAIFARSAS